MTHERQIIYLNKPTRKDAVAAHKMAPMDRFNKRHRPVADQLRAALRVRRMSVIDRRATTMPRAFMVSEQQCNIEFVKTVEKYPCLYNFTLPEYTRKDMSEKAWEEVAEASNMTPSACKERWRNLRAVFMRTMKQRLAGTKKKPYYLSDVMQFILPFLQPTRMSEAEKNKMKKLEFSSSEAAEDVDPPALEVDVEEIKSEIVDDDTGQSSHDWSIESPSSSRKQFQEVEDYPPPSKRPAIRISATSSAVISESSDPVSSFMNSLMPELREMNSAQFKAFKRRVLVLIDDITAEIPSTTRNGNEYVAYDN